MKDDTKVRMREAIKKIIGRKKPSRSELAIASRIRLGTVGKIYRGYTENISTERLIRITRKIGMNLKLQLLAAYSVRNRR